MKAMVLAAGEGTRLRPLTDSVPKPMLPVGGRPLIARTIDLLREHGVREVAINLHHCAAAITDYLRDGTGFGVEVTYSYEHELLGSAGAVKRLDWFFDGGPFFVVYGDVLSDLDLGALRAFHVERGAALSLALHQPDDASRCGVATVDGDGRIAAFVEKPAPGATGPMWANAGIMVIEPGVLADVPAEQPFDFGRDLIPLLIERGAPVFGWKTDALVVDIGSPERYRLAQSLVTRDAA